MVGVVISIVVFILLIVIISGIKIVPQASAYVVERLGAYHETWQTGMHFRLPILDRIAKTVSLK